MRVIFDGKALEQIDEIAAREGISREEVITRAMNLYMVVSARTVDRKSVIALYNEEENSVTPITFSEDEDDGDDMPPDNTSGNLKN